MSTDAHPSDDEDLASKFGRTLESSLIGAIEFIARYIRTAWNAMVRPSRVIADLDDPSELSLCARPFTFFILSCLIGGVALSHRDVTSALFGNSLLASLQYRLQVVSPWSILKITFPVVLMVVGGSLIIARIAFGDVSGLRGTGVKLLCVCSGCQLVLAFLRSLIVVGCAWWKKLTFQGGRSQPVFSDTEEVVVGIAVLLFSVIAWCGAVPAVYTFVQSRHPEKRTVVRCARMLTAFVVSIVLFWLANFGAASAGIVGKFRELDQAMIGHLGEEVNSEVISGTVSRSSGRVQLSLLVANSRKDIRIFAPTIWSVELALSRYLTEDLQPVEGDVRATVVRWEGDAPIVRIEANGTAWIEVECDDNSNIASAVQEILATLEKPDSTHEIGLDYKISFDGKAFVVFDVRGSGDIKVVE